MGHTIPIEKDAGRIALVLAGAGAKGAFQARLWWQLERRGLRADHVIGVSAGSLNAAKISCNQTYALMKVWERTRERDVIRGGLSLRRAWQLWRETKKSLYDTGPLYNLVFSEYHPDDTVIPMTIGWVNFDSGAYETLTVFPDDTYGRQGKKEIIDRIMASSAVPVTHPPVLVDGAPAMDGGVRNIAPLGDAARLEADQVIVILAEPLRMEGRDVDLSSIVDVGGRALGILLNEIIAEDVQHARQINHNVKEAEAAGVQLTHRRTGRLLRPMDITVLMPDRTLGSGTDFSEDALRNRFLAADALNDRIRIV